MKHAVPDALNQLNVKTAPYGVGLPVTGGMRVIALCRPGTLRPLTVEAFFKDHDPISEFVHLSIAALIVGWPAMSTAATSSMYGSHAASSSPAECRFIVAVT